MVLVHQGRAERPAERGKGGKGYREGEGISDGGGGGGVASAIYTVVDLY